MGLSHQQSLLLKNTTTILYHESVRQDGVPFYFFIEVGGDRITSYFDFIAKTSSFAMDVLEQFGSILVCKTGKLTDADFNELKKRYPVGDPR